MVGKRHHSRYHIDAFMVQAKPGSEDFQEEQACAWASAGRTHGADSHSGVHRLITAH